MTTEAEDGRRVLLRRGCIYAPAGPPATAMLVTGSDVEWVGTETEAESVAGSVNDIVDLDGRFVTPAFVDAHVHLSMTGRALSTLDLSSCDSLSVALERLASYAAELPPDSAVFASGWDESTWPERRPLTMADLDGCTAGRVVYAARVDSHSAAVSSALLERDAGMARKPGWRGDGVVEREAHHAARAALHGLWTTEKRREALLLALRCAASRGIGTLHELNAPHIAPVDDWMLLAELAETEPLPEVICYWGELHGGNVPADAVLGFAGDLCVDGSIGSRTAGLREPYADSNSTGYLYLDAEEIASHLIFCTERGLQAGFHVIGDRALDEVIAGLRAAEQTVGRSALAASRHRLEHVEMPSVAAIRTLAHLGVTASVQPAFDATWGGPGGLYEQRLGRFRAEGMNPFATLADAGVGLAFGSDSPVTPLAPWAGVRAAVHHNNPDERLKPQVAFAAATTGGHSAARRDGHGVLAPGKPATYAVWDVSGDLVDGLPDLTDEGAVPRCLETVVSGTVVFDELTAKGCP